MWIFCLNHFFFQRYKCIYINYSFKSNEMILNENTRKLCILIRVKSSEQKLADYVIPKRLPKITDSWIFSVYCYLLPR